MHINDDSMIYRQELLPDKDFGFYHENAIFVGKDTFHKHYAMISNTTPSTLADRLLNDPTFRDEFISMPKLVDTVKVWLRSNDRDQDDYSVAETCKTIYEIARWNAGLKDTDPRKTDLSDAKLWTSLPLLMRAYCDTWLKEEEGKAIIQDLLNDVIPYKVQWKIESFCSYRLSWLGLAKNKSIIDDMYQQVHEVLYKDDRKALRRLKAPGTLWRYIQTIVDNLFNNVNPKMCFTESFERKKDNGKPFYTYAHLSLYTWSYSSLEYLLQKENLYNERIKPLLRSLVEQYYKPEDQNSPSGNDAIINLAIKKELHALFDSFQKKMAMEGKTFPFDNKDKDISLSYDCTFRKGYSLTIESNSSLKQILTPGEEIPEIHEPTEPISEDDPRPSPSSYPCEADEIPLSNSDALAIWEEIFGDDDSEEVRVYKTACYFETRLYGNNDPSLSKRYAYKLDDLHVFHTDCPRGSNNYMVNWTKTNDKTHKRFALGAKKALREKRITNKDVILLIKFFRTRDFLDIYNQLKNTTYAHI